MSMLSAQCDDLRELAARYDELQAGAVKAVTMPSNMGPILRDAADTIWELRDSVHRERAEADKLRERITTQKQTIQAYRDESREWREVADHVQAENAKLRELVAGIGHLLFTLDVDYCATCPKDSINHPYPVYTVDGGECLYKADLRELGIEVDDGTE